MENGINRNQILKELGRSAHGDLTQYIPIFSQATQQDPEFVAHLIAYDSIKGNIRDTKVALPIISMAISDFDEIDLLENSMAHLAKLTPRELHEAYMFAKGFVVNHDVKEVVEVKDGKSRVRKQRVGGWKAFGRPGLLGKVNRQNMLDRLVRQYLQYRESDKHMFDRNVANFGRSMRRLYKLTKTVPSPWCKSVLYDGFLPPGSMVEAIAHLPNMSAPEAAATILKFKIPFLMLFPILREKMKDNGLLLMAMIDRMSATELQTNMKMLERMGVRNYPETRAALEQGLVRIAKSTKTALKTTKAAEAVVDIGMKERMLATQEKQIANMQGIEGNWVVLVDASGSMQAAIEKGCEIAGALAKFTKGHVLMAYFNTMPRVLDVTGRTYEEIKDTARHVRAIGGTSIGCGLLGAVEAIAVNNLGWEIDGISIVSDGGENNAPFFAPVYKSYCDVHGGKQIPVYFYQLDGDRDSLTTSMASYGYAMENRDLRSTKVDHYSVTNLVATQRSNRYSLVQEVMDTPLLTIKQVLESKKEKEAVSVV